jgi:hypothetical protein
VVFEDDEVEPPVEGRGLIESPATRTTKRRVLARCGGGARRSSSAEAEAPLSRTAGFSQRSAHPKGGNEGSLAGALRISWCHLTPDVDWEELVGRIRSLRG